MNNAGLQLEEQEEVDVTPRIREEEAKLVRIIEALQGIQSTKEWSTLKTEIFDYLVESLERQLKIEAKKDNPDPNKLNRIVGELKWAEKYSDLKRLEDFYRVQLTNVKINLNGKQTD